MEERFMNPEYYDNREMSWLSFNYRIFDEAADKNLLLFERLKFLSITASNMDEFFMVRVASLIDMIHAGYEKKDIAGMTPQMQLAAISEETHRLVNDQYALLGKSLLPTMKKEGLILLTAHEELSSEEASYVDEFFMENVYPVVTPMAVDSSRPFPLIRNKTLNIAALLEKKEKEGAIGTVENEKKERDIDFATVQVPSVLPRLVKLPEGKDKKVKYILLEEIIERNIGRLFLNYDVLCAHPYRIMRNADFEIDEEETEDLLVEIQKQLKKRQWGEVIRLETQSGIDRKLLKFLKKELEVKDDAIYLVEGPLDLTFLMKMYGVEGFDRLRIKKHIPQAVPAIDPELSIFDNIRKGDILIKLPYQTFDPVVDFIRQASVDPSVLAIKQTLYRVSGNSPIISALAKAAENGKQVSVLVELKARFDEENNIIWAQKLEKAGCHVIYGLKGLKTHSKITLVVRREEDGIMRYVHLATGNYNDATAKLYTDMGIFTANRSIGEDATAVFNMLSGYSEPLGWNSLSLAPLWLRNRFVSLISRETKMAKQGKRAKIIAKMNSLCDPEIIANLYEASSAGVEIDLIVRGICCLIPGIAGVSENIRVRSIVGNFLEHSRIFYFENGGDSEIYMSSADWMPRNLDRRVEILFPVLNEQLKQELVHVLQVELSDNLKARIKQSDSTYVRAEHKGREGICSQEVFAREAEEAARELESEKESSRVFVPMKGDMVKE